jgi:hypothetical protein
MDLVEEETADELENIGLSSFGNEAGNGDNVG